jgi:hypothetical protein
MIFMIDITWWMVESARISSSSAALKAGPVRRERLDRGKEFGRQDLAAHLSIFAAASLRTECRLARVARAGLQLARDPRVGIHAPSTRSRRAAGALTHQNVFVISITWPHGRTNHLNLGLLSLPLSAPELEYTGASMP